MAKESSEVEINRLLAKICEQLDAGRFSISMPIAGWYLRIYNPTEEIKRLIEIVEREHQTNKEVGLCPFLFRVNPDHEFPIEKLFYSGFDGLPADSTSTCFIAWLRSYPNSNTYWTNGVINTTPERGAIFPFSDGCVKANGEETDGMYLALVNKINKENMKANNLSISELMSLGT